MFCVECSARILPKRVIFTWINIFHNLSANRLVSREINSRIWPPLRLLTCSWRWLALCRPPVFSRISGPPWRNQRTGRRWAPRPGPSRTWSGSGSPHERRRAAEGRVLVGAWSEGGGGGGGGEGEGEVTDWWEQVGVSWGPPMERSRVKAWSGRWNNDRVI